MRVLQIRESLASTERNPSDAQLTDNGGLFLSSGSEDCRHKERQTPEKNAGNGIEPGRSRDVNGSVRYRRRDFEWWKSSPEQCVLPAVVGTDGHAPQLPTTPATRQQPQPTQRFLLVRTWSVDAATTSADTVLAATTATATGQLISVQ